MLTRLFGDTLIPQSGLPAFAAANPNAVLRGPNQVTWFTKETMFKIVWSPQTHLYSGWAYDSNWNEDDLDEDDSPFAFVHDRNLETVVERLHAQWQHHIK